MRVSIKSQRLLPLSSEPYNNAMERMKFWEYRSFISLTKIEKREK